MAKAKGSPKTGGRRKDTPNKDTQYLIALAKRLNVDPFEVLLLFAKGDWKALGYKKKDYPRGIDPYTRMKSAADACQYIYAKRKAIEHSGSIEKTGGIFGGKTPEERMIMIEKLSARLGLSLPKKEADK